MKSIAEELLRQEIQYFEDNDEVENLERAQKELSLIQGSLVKKEVHLTNADHIRNMTDEELADFVINGCWGQKGKKMERSEVVEWLREEDSIPRSEVR